MCAALTRAHATVTRPRCAMCAGLTRALGARRGPSVEFDAWRACQSGAEPCERVLGAIFRIGASNLVSRGKNPTFLRVRTCFMSCPLTFLSTRFTPLEHLSTLAARRCAGRPNVYDKKWTLERDHYDKLCKRFSSRNRGHGSMFSQ